MQPLEQIVVFT